MKNPFLYVASYSPDDRCLVVNSERERAGFLDHV